MFLSSPSFLLLLASLGAAPTWEIPGIEVRLEVGENRTLHVTEFIHVNFGPHPRRGIDRQLPTRIHHPIAGPLDLRLRVRGVTEGGNVPVPYTVLEGEHYLAVRLGDPDTTRTGESIYRLEYDVDGAIVVGMNRVSLSWPVVGGEWNAAIFQAEAVVQLRRAADASEVFAGSWTGYFGDSGRPADVQIADPQRVVYRQVRGLKPHERLGIHASWPRSPEADAGPAAGGIPRLPRTVLAVVALLAAALLFIYLRRRAVGAD